jgi:hypothetical protein
MRSFAKTWLTDKSVYPLWGVLGAALSVAGVYSYRGFKKPDIWYRKNAIPEADQATMSAVEAHKHSGISQLSLIKKKQEKNLEQFNLQKTG